MTAFRVFSLPAHGVVEMLIGTLLMVSPFALGMGPAALVLAVVLGALIVGFGIGAADGLPVATHFAFDQGVTAGLLVGSLALGIDGDMTGAIVFCVVAIAQLMLTATTRYVRPLRP